MKSLISCLFQIIILSSILLQFNCEQFRFEITRKDNLNDLKSMKIKQDNEKQQELSSAFTSNFEKNEEYKSEMKGFKNKYVSHFQQVQSSESNQPESGNSTIFSLINQHQEAYLINIYIGSKSQEFQVHLDMGSQFTWVTQQNCERCLRNRFNCDDSKTCVSKHKKYYMQSCFGVVSGEASIYQDKIGFQKDKFIANNQDFLLVQTFESRIIFYGDGVLGLGFSSLRNGHKTVLDNLKEQGHISKKVFAFSLSEEGDKNQEGVSEKDFFILGDDVIDPNLADQNKYFSCPVTNQHYWAVDFLGISASANQSDFETNLNLYSNVAIISTLSSLIILNEQDFKLVINFFKQFKNLQCEKKYFWLLSCKQTDKSQYPTFKFNFCKENNNIEIFPDQYLECSKDDCDIKIYGYDLGFFEKNFVILGDSFLRRKYVVFNQEEMKGKSDKKGSLNLKQRIESSVKRAKESIESSKKDKVKKGKDVKQENIQQKLKKELNHKY